jgi:hypothetical protein
MSKRFCDLTFQELIENHCKKDCKGFNGICPMKLEYAGTGIDCIFSYININTGFEVEEIEE